MKVRLENLIDYNTLKSLLPFFYHANVFFKVNVVMMKSEFSQEKFGHLTVFWGKGRKYTHYMLM